VTPSRPRVSYRLKSSANPSQSRSFHDRLEPYVMALSDDRRKSDEYAAPPRARNLCWDDEVVARAGIEPATQGFSVLCSTN
jgi:hypothetical protein